MQKTEKLPKKEWEIDTCPICEKKNKLLTYKKYVYMDRYPIAYSYCCKECAVLEGI